MEIENLVFEGGGVHGLGYIGALKHLERAGLLAGVRRVAGTSVGALIAAFTACGLTPAEMEIEVRDITKYLLFGTTSVCRALVNVYKRWGMYDLSLGMSRWLEDVFRRRLGNANITMSGIAKECHITVFNVTRMRNDVISAATAPHARLVDALAAAMSVQLLFVPLPIPNCGTTDIYADGGLTNNMPLYIFDAGAVNPRTLGIRSVEADSIVFAADIGTTPPAPRSVLEYLRALAAVLVESGQQRHERAEDAQRTFFMKMPRAIGSFDFDISAEARRELIQLGEDGMRDWFRLR